MKKSVLTILAVFGLSLAPFAIQESAGATELKLAHFMSPKHPYHAHVFEWLGAELDAATDGELTIRVYPGGELGPGPVEQFNRAIDGVADIAFGLHGYTAPQFPRSLLMEYPGVAKSSDSAARGYWNAIDLIGDEYKRVKVLGLWTITPAAIFSREKPIRSLDDLQGLKVRVASKGHGAVITAWGATPVFMPVTEVYNSMQTGVVDATLIDPGAALAFKLNEVSKSMTVGMQSPLATFFLVMNRDSWDALSDEQKAIFEDLTGLSLSERAHTAWIVASKKGFELMDSDPDREVIRLSADEAARFDAASSGVLGTAIADLEGRGIPASEIVEAMGVD